MGIHQCYSVFFSSSSLGLYNFKFDLQYLLLQFPSPKCLCLLDCYWLNRLNNEKNFLALGFSKLLSTFCLSSTSCVLDLFASTFVKVYITSRFSRRVFQNLSVYSFLTFSSFQPSCEILFWGKQKGKKNTGEKKKEVEEKEASPFFFFFAFPFLCLVFKQTQRGKRKKKRGWKACFLWLCKLLFV